MALSAFLRRTLCVAAIVAACDLSTPRAPTDSALAVDTPTAAPDDAPIVRARRDARELYVAAIDHIAGDSDAERALFTFARGHRITRLVIYGHRSLLLENPDGAARLCSFVTHARANGIAWVTAPVGWKPELESITDYVRSHPDCAIDELSTELEYWHDCETPPTAHGGAVRPCFEPMRMLLAQMGTTRAALARDHTHLALSAYLGWPSRDEALLVAAAVDRVLLHYEQPAPRRAYYADFGAWGSLRDRLGAFAGRVEVWPIFYAAGAANMREYLAREGLTTAEGAWLSGLDEETAPWAPALELGGFTYFDYDGLLGATSESDDTTHP